jgi:hypothetical protein
VPRALDSSGALAYRDLDVWGVRLTTCVRYHSIIRRGLARLMASCHENLLFLWDAIGMRLILWGTLGARSPPSGIFVVLF